MRIFMIRSSVDAEFTNALEVLGRDIYRDRWSFDPLLESDPDWWPKAQVRIHQCHAVLWMVSAGSVKSIPCRGEARYALRIRRPLMLWYVDRVHVPGFALGHALGIASPEAEMADGLATLHRALRGEPAS